MSGILIFKRSDVEPGDLVAAQDGRLLFMVIARKARNKHAAQRIAGAINGQVWMDVQPNTWAVMFPITKGGNDNG